ncbi:TadE/TadG family type IV pilus assembly protein [Arthrobacter sp. PM3]|uniref:TadE/TadG family type IV pilus assembly protein n=1 Tax=Arthrobacter sp. PM3 TaxID=2017685 RepID=UPI000E102932|nr:TadE family protein [Arthrobacter sp. PM3]AXJ08247.1 TadE family protein [Arthrobacter sp. PM3]
MKRSSSSASQHRAPARERGAVAVEFALVLPILLALVGGIIEFSYIYNLQISVTQAAREAARTMAIKNDVGLAKAAAVAGAPGLTAANFGFSFSGACKDGENTTVTVTYKSAGVTGMFGDLYTLTGVGAMRCGG